MSKPKKKVKEIKEMIKFNKYVIIPINNGCYCHLTNNDHFKEVLNNKGFVVLSMKNIKALRCIVGYTKDKKICKQLQKKIDNNSLKIIKKKQIYEIQKVVV